MKRTYEVPTLVVSGDVVRATNAIPGSPVEGGQLTFASGSMGFGL